MIESNIYLEMILHTNLDLTGVRRFFRQIFTILTSLIVKMGPLKLSSLPLNDRSFSV